MSTYVIGDIQGCFRPFVKLLKQVGFRPQTDTLWCAGDLVNRGPDSLSVLRFLLDMPKPPVVVLGNHDLHLLAIYYGQARLEASDTLSPVLEAPDSELLCDWLRHQPLIHLDKDYGYTLLHAGLPPQWTSVQAKQYAIEVETLLASAEGKTFLAHMYGKAPYQWNEQLTGWGRLRFIVNVLTRIRFCTLEGRLNFSYKGVVGSQAKGLYPWFQIPQRASAAEKIIFGHWAALGTQIILSPNLFALDTGCVWGRQLTAMRLEDQQFFYVNCEKTP
jgi:bis(5'-nucleosyl)-tetraphosphatase (symmetrical)